MNYQIEIIILFDFFFIIHITLLTLISLDIIVLIDILFYLQYNANSQ